MNGQLKETCCQYGPPYKPWREEENCDEQSVARPPVTSAAIPVSGNDRWGRRNSKAVTWNKKENTPIIGSWWRPITPGSAARSAKAIANIVGRILSPIPRALIRFAIQALTTPYRFASGLVSPDRKVSALDFFLSVYGTILLGVLGVKLINGDGPLLAILACYIPVLLLLLGFATWPARLLRTMYREELKKLE
jgi:hypothetical protein